MIGFFGGSFDPVHYGHLETAHAIKQELSLEKIFLMPCKAPVHKRQLFFSNQQRLDMLNLALKEFDELRIDTRELDRQSASYTIDTLKQIKMDYPSKKVFLIMGTDNFNTLETWKDYQQFGNYAQLVVLPRPVDTKKTIQSTDIYFAKTPLVDTSSTQIRDILSAALKSKITPNLSGLLPKNIISYLQQL